MRRQATLLRSVTLVTALVCAPQLAFANHPVLVEGELDFDGDGVVGLSEDNDGDVVFGTITRALGAAPAIGQNGTVVIVTSGRFPEVVTISNQVTLEAAPGVDVQIDAFLVPADARLNEFPAAQADPFALQNAPGIIIDSPADRYVTVRNVGIQNWTDGIVIRGDSNVLLDNVRPEHNINNGINIQDRAVVLIKNSSVAATGFRLNPMTGNFPTANVPMPGVGVSLAPGTSTAITTSTISGNFQAGIAIGIGARLALSNSVVFGNQRVQQLGLPAPLPMPMDGMMMMDDGQMMGMDPGMMMMMGGDPLPAPAPDPTPAPAPDPTPAPTPDPAPEPDPAPAPDPDPAPAPGDGASDAPPSIMQQLLSRFLNN